MSIRPDAHRLLPEEPDLDALKADILARFPEHRDGAFSLLKDGWDCIAVDVDDAWIFKFPRRDAARISLLREAQLLAALRTQLPIPVPELMIVEGPLTFSRHAKLKGRALLADEYDMLPDGARNRLAKDLATFYAALHGIPMEVMRAAGAGPVWPWFNGDTILSLALPHLPGHLHLWARTVIGAWRTLPPDPHGIIYGFFDGHGWNMAFDHHRQRLNGLYDFADSGFGPLHQDFIYSNFISPDLTLRVIEAYEISTGLRINRRRVWLLTAAHRLFELAEADSDPAEIAKVLPHVLAWSEVPAWE